MSAAAIRPVHDARAWLLFFLVATMLLATVPLAQNAQAQLPIPLPGQTEDPDPEPTNPPADDPSEEEGPIPALPSGGDEEEPAPSTGEIKTAYFTAPADDLVANTDAVVTAQCILVPDSCTPDAQQITGPVLGGVGQAEEGVASAPQPAQPVPPGALPIGLLNGNERYSSAVDIGPPNVAAGKSVDEYLISFQISSASFALESPAFRAAILAALSSTDGSSDAFQAYFESVAAQETPLLTPNITGVEACVITEPWEAGDNQDQEAKPEIDFFYCSAAAYPDENNVLTFDMTFPAQDALTDNEAFKLDWSNGILIRPLAAPNLAYGDADYSTNYYMYIEPLTDNPPEFSTVEVDKPTPQPTTPPREPQPATNSGSSGSSGGSSRPSTSSGSSRPSTSSSSASRPSSPAASSGGSTTTPANTSPAAASPLGDITAATGAAETGEAAPLDFTPVNEPTKSFPMAWILLPMLLGGAFWYGRVLDGAPLTAVVRAGAMTRLLRERGFQV